MTVEVIVEAAAIAGVEVRAIVEVRVGVGVGVEVEVEAEARAEVATEARVAAKTAAVTWRAAPAAPTATSRNQR